MLFWCKDFAVTSTNGSGDAQGVRSPTLCGSRRQSRRSIREPGANSGLWGRWSVEMLKGETRVSLEDFLLRQRSAGRGPQAPVRPPALDFSLAKRPPVWAGSSGRRTGKIIPRRAKIPVPRSTRGRKVGRQHARSPPCGYSPQGGTIMVSFDQYQLELQCQLDRAAKRGTKCVIVTATELNLAVGGHLAPWTTASTPWKARWSKAMRC